MTEGQQVDVVHQGEGVWVVCSAGREALHGDPLLLGPLREGVHACARAASGLPHACRVVKPRLDKAETT